ncbi:Myb/SANT-like domain-containing protein [Heracleum sosnowskyi]|uniref:Myb/SANT-like domain-containing protein n=1 Tax=Heracleum sosnowskyi TaxID=360622 RepID=A0AAD8N655_9APIA|nr:Myb/SANT-like domain-containing protein [Heracleum sosnowskyi]
MGQKAKDGDVVKREQLIWTPIMDSLFIQSMLNQQYEGHRIDGTFTSQAYVNMVAEMRQKLNIELNKAHLKNRLKTLKEHFAQCYDLFRGVGLSGFSWNSETKLFEATDDVWDQLLVVKLDAIKWKTKPILNYNELEELFAKDRATGAGAETAKEKNKRRSSIGSDYSIDDINDLLTQNTVNLESLNNDNDVQFVAATPSPHETSNSTTEAKGKKRKCEEEEDINKGKKKKCEEEDDINKKITTSLENVASAIMEGHTILKENNVILEKSRQRVYTEEEIYTGLETIGFDETKICEAYLFLVNHPESARAMFGCPVQTRKKILEEIMNKRG